MFKETSASELAAGDFFILIETGEELKMTEVIEAPTTPIAYAHRTCDGVARWFKMSTSRRVVIIQ